MKNAFRLGLALLPLAFVFPSLSAHAQAAPTIVISGSREPLQADRLAADVVVIDGAAIRRSTADSLADLLRREAGVQLSRSGGPGHSSTAFIRGATSGQTVVLVDGVRVGSATLGLPALDNLALAQIERIEVLRGPGSSLYGADAVGGVVQIFTRRGTDGTRFDARAAVGGYGSQELSAGVSGAAGAWDYAASLSSDKSDGVSTLRPGDQYGNYNPDKDGFKLDSAQVQFGFRPAPGHRIGLSVIGTRLNTQYDASEYPPPDYAQDNTPDFRDRQRTEVAALDWRGTLSPTLVGSARINRSVDDSRSGGNEIAHFRTTRHLFGAQLAWAAGALGQLIGAVERNEEQASSTSYLEDVQRNTNAFILALAGEAAGWSWQADLRRDDSSDFGTANTGRAGGSVVLAPGLRLRALAGTTFRAPSFNDLYFPGYGVPTLDPERGRSVELGLNWRSATTEAAASVYLNKVRDLIGYEGDRSFCPPDPAYDFGCARNTSRARLQGATFSAAHRMGALALKGQIDFLDATDEDTGARLPRRAAHQASLAGDWTAGNWNLGASVLNVGARPDAGKQLAAETTLDLSAGWRFAKAWQLQGKLLNATDRDLEPARDYQGLGRQAWVALRYEGGL